MNKNILNKNGTALIGLLMSVLVIALVFFGSFYFHNKVGGGLDDLAEGDVIDVYKGAQNDIEEINETVELRNEELLNKEKLNDSVVENVDLENWHSLKRENEGFEMKYPQGWYYTVNHKEAKEKGYEIVIGFEPDEKVWDQEPPYSIELIVSLKEVNSDGFVYLKEIESENEERYFIRTGKNNIKADYDIYIKGMIESFNYIK